MTIDAKIFELEYSGDSSKYVWKLPSGNGLVSGIDRLAQQVAKSLLTTPGSDLRFPQWGGGAEGIPPIMHDSTEIVSKDTNDIMFAVSKVESDIIASQQRNPVPSNEALLSLDVVDIELVDLSNVTLFIRIVTADKVDTKLELNV
mgnify:CR=1 FL=1